MSEVTKDKAFDRAVDLVINQDHVIQQWIGRFITVQTSLAVAAAALISWKGSNGFVVVTLAILIGIIASMLAYAMTQIIKREYEWQERYVEMVKDIEGDEPLLYKKNYEHLRGKDISTTFAQIQLCIIVGWSLVILMTTIVAGLRFVLSIVKVMFGC